MEPNETAPVNPVDLKLLLDQYNKQIAYTRDIAQKVLLMILAYLYAHVSYQQLRVDEANHRVAFCLAHLVIIVFVVVLQWSNYRRTAALHAQLSALGSVAGFKLLDIGILGDDPKRLLVTWLGAYLVIHVIFVFVAYVLPMLPG